MSRKHFCLQLNSFFRETGTCPDVSPAHTRPLALQERISVQHLY